MITTLDIGDILYRDLNLLKSQMGIANIYQDGNVPVGEVVDERIVIVPPPNSTDETYWTKAFANVNLVVPDKNGKKDITRLQILERFAKKNLDDHCGKFDGTTYTYEVSTGIENEPDLKAHFVNVKILFSILNVKL